MFKIDFITYTLTPVLAFIGAVLSVVNFFLEYKSRRVSVSVALSGSAHRDMGTIALTVVNNSLFPITVEEGGFLIDGSKFQCLYGPRRIESRDTKDISANIAINDQDAGGQTFTKISDIQHATHIYAVLVDGKVWKSQTGVKPTLNQIASTLAAFKAK